MSQQIFTDNFLIQQRANLRGENSKSYVAEYVGDEFKGNHILSNSFRTLEIEQVPENLGERMVNSFLTTSSDFECGRILYEALNYLTSREASNPGFWTYLHHYNLFPYLKLRWPDLENPPNKSSSENYILNHWLQNNSSQAELMDYPLSGLWWSFYISEIKENENPYELTKILFSNFSFRTKNFGQSKVARHKEAVIGVLEFVKENQIHLNNFESNGQAITTYVNLLGGIKPLSFFKRSWFKERLRERFPELVIENDKRKILQRKKNQPEVQTSAGWDLKDGIHAESEPQMLLFFLDIVKRPQRLFLNTKSSPDAAISLPILKKYEDGFLLFCYDNGQVNRVPVNALLNKPLDSATPVSYVYRESDLLQVLPSREEGLLFVTGKGSRGPAGKIYETEFIPTNEHLTSKGKKLLNRKNILGYEFLPLGLKSKVQQLISYGPHILFDQQEYPKEWAVIEQYRQEREKEIVEEKEFIDEAEKSFLNIYNASGKFFFSKGKPASSTISVELPEHYEDKCLFLFYDNGQVGKIPLKNLPPFSSELQNDGKYPRAQLTNLEIGFPDSNILVSRYKSRRTCVKIHKAEWITDAAGLNEKGKEIVDLPNKLSYALLPPDLPPSLQRMVAIDVKYGIDLNHWVYKDQKKEIKMLVADFFAD